MIQITIYKKLYVIYLKKNKQLHAVSRTKPGRQRESSVKTLRSPLSAIKKTIFSLHLNVPNHPLAGGGVKGLQPQTFCNTCHYEIFFPACDERISHNLPTWNLNFIHESTIQFVIVSYFVRYVGSINLLYLERLYVFNYLCLLKYYNFQ